MFHQMKYSWLSAEGDMDVPRMIRIRERASEVFTFGRDLVIRELAGRPPTG
jgi:hypothetical protein